MRVDLSQGEEVEVQMAPLIDCVFLLLVFFLVATTLKKIEVEVPLELPTAGLASREVPVKSDQLTISIDRQGEIYLGAQVATPGALHDVIRARAAEDKDQVVRVDADWNAPWSSVLQVMELLKFEGMTNVRPGTARSENH